MAVRDARTVALADDRVLRLAGIEPFTLLRDDAELAEAALQKRLATLVGAGPLHIRILSETPDRYGRLEALVALADGRLAQEVAVSEGLAIAFASGAAPPCFAEMLAVEDRARRNGHGFWANEPLRRAEPADLQARIGRFAIFEGAVNSVGNRPGRTYLNFGTWWAKDVTVEIAARHRDLFGGEAALAALAGKRVRVRGFLRERSGPLIAAASPAQIERLDDVTAKTGKTP